MKSPGVYTRDEDLLPPPPPDGSGIVAVSAGGADATPLPPDGSGIAPDNAQPGTGADTIGDIGANLPDAPQTRLSPEDDAKWHDMLQKGANADQLIQFAADRGFSVDRAKVQAVVDARDAGKKYDPDPIYELAKVDTSAGGAFARGAGQGASLGFGDELYGLGAGAKAALTGGDFGDAYNRAVDENRANLGADNDQHFLASLAGNLAGGAVLPLGLEKAGVTASVRSVGLAARDAAIAEGVAPEAANRIAARAITHRLALEGAGYGGAYGAGTNNGSVGDRLVGGVEGATTGVLAALGLRQLGKGSAAIGRGIRSAYNAATRSVTKAGATRRASDILHDSALRPVEDILDDIANRPEPVSGSYPTLGEVAGDSGLAGLQRGVANSSPSASGPISERLAQNAMARTAYADDALGAGNPQAIQDIAAERLAGAQGETATQQIARGSEAEGRLAQGRANAANAQNNARSALEGGREAIGSLTDRSATGAAAREQFDNAYSAAKARTRAAYNDPALTKPQPVSIPKSVFSDIIQTANDFYGDAGGEMPSAMRGILDDLAGDPANTRVLTNIDRRLADVAGTARMSGKRSEAAFAEQVRHTLGGYVETNAPEAYRNALKNAKAVRAEQGRVFETGDAPKVFSLDRFGNPVVGDTTVPARLVRPGAAGGDTADGLIAAIGPDAAEQTMRQELRRAIDEGGVSTEAQARSLAAKYGEAAKRFPSLQNDLQSLVGHAGRLDAANVAARDAERATVTTAEKAHISELSAAEQAIKASPLSRVADASVDPASFVSGLLNRSDGGRMLKRLASYVSDNPEAIAGLRRSFGQYIVDAGAGVRNTAAGDDIPALAKTRKAISTIITRAGDLLTPQQKIALQRVGRELKATNFAMNAGRPSGSDTAQNQAYKAALHFLPLPPEARAAKAVYSAIISHFSNREQVQHLITQAILDPDFAATLLKRPTAAHLDAARSTLLGRKAVLATTLIVQPGVSSLSREMAQ